MGRLVAAQLRLSRVRLPAAMLLVALSLGFAADALARDVAVTGLQMPRYGRILLRFDQRTKVNVRVTNGVMVVGFAEPSRIRVEKLAAELSPYISSVRRDPDDTGLRLALTGTVQPSVLEAGERVFIDLLPPNWVGLPPGLPPEIVAELAERARAAEARLREEAGRQAPPPKPVTMRVAELPTLTRFVFEPPAGTAIRIKQNADSVEAGFDGPVGLDEAGAKPRVAAGVKSFAASAGERGLALRIGALPGYTVRAFEEEGTLVVDLATPAGLARPGVPEPKPAPAAGHGEVVPPHGEPAAAKAEAPHAPGPAGPVPADPPPRIVKAAPPQMPPQMPAPPVRLPSGTAAREAATIVPVIEATGETATVTFPFGVRTAAAAFESPGGVTLVFETPARIVPPVIADTPEAPVRVESVRQDDRLATVRLAIPSPRPMRLAPEGESWRLVVGGRDATPPDAMRVTRAADESGDATVTVPLAGASGAHWFQDGAEGGRYAVVTAFGRPQGLPKAMNFVEFGLSATLQGLVVTARADDLSVSLGSAGVLVGRKGGLALSSRGTQEGGTNAADRVVFNRDVWTRDQAGNVYQRANELVLAAADAPRAARAEARFREARFLVANGMNEEAAAVLAVARAADAVAARRRDLTLLSGVANLRAGRPREAAVFLSADTLVDEPEGVLWRAMLDVRLRRWPQAAAGFRRSGEVLSFYAEDLAAQVRLAAFQSYAETGDVPRAEAEIAALDQLPSDVLPAETRDFAHARLDEAAGRADAALKAYGRLVDEAGRRTWAEATLRGVSLGLRTGKVSDADALARLEVLSAAWRGDDIELGALLESSRLYGRASRWRDVFNVMRRANRLFPTADLTRVLHDETALLFERLFLGDLGRNLTSVEALGLYFDFRELAPVGRRGDEIVRRLADRLVELDLLEQAADLLQHQVDKRLTGAARATVAARLAAVHLLNGRPALALTTLSATRLAGLPDETRRLRVLLEAQTLADLSRTDVALETLEGETGTEFDRLRMNILWRAKRWREAGELAEALVGRRWEGAEPLAERDRSDVQRAVIAYTLADEPLALGRVRAKFTAKMADSPEAGTFDELLQPGAVQTRAFRAAALKVQKVDGVRDLLEAWREAHPGTLAEAITPPAAPVPPATPPGTQAHGGAPAAPPV